MGEKDYVLVPHEKPFQYDEAGLHVTRGCAWSGPGCHDGCGVLMYTDDDGRLVKVEGDPEHPYNQGRLCQRCLDVREVVYHKDRLSKPLVRDRADRGKDAWHEVSWDEAFDLVADKFKEISEKYGPESIVFGQGTGRDVAQWLLRLAWSVGSPNHLCYGMSGVACYMPRIMAGICQQGGMTVADCSQQFADRYDNPLYKVPELMVVWGNNPIVSNSDGFYGHWVVDLMRRGTKLIVVDPKVNWLTRHSELHLALRPGTDAALALGILNVLIEENLYDHDFVDRWTYGFDELAERVKEYPPSRVSEITWVPEEKIIEAARMIGKADSAALQWGVAVDMVKQTLPAGQAIMSIFHITGNIEKPGTNILPPTLLSYASAGWGAEFLTPEQEAKIIGGEKYPLCRLIRTCNADELMHAMETGEPYAIHGLYLQACNVIACMGTDPRRVYEATKKLDFIVNVDLFMTPTAMAFADVLLPAATYPERDGLCVICGAQRADTINKVLETDRKSDMEINLEIGRRINPEAWPWKNVQAMFDDVLTSTAMSFKEVQECGPAMIPFEYNRHEKGLLRADGQPGFGTLTGRIELYSTIYASAGIDPLPYFEEPTPGPGSTPELMEEYPLILSTGSRRHSSFHSEHRQIERLRSQHPDPVLEVHPETAKRYGVRDGDWVWVENQFGRAKRRVKETPIWGEKIVSSDHGWWYPEADPEQFYDAFELNINNLIPFGNGDGGFGCNYKCSLCKIYKAKDGE
ncbi:MAG TPA: molybdopterin-dependent oxidoreductase [Coriobacteriaceae bacterium]|nr:molybdopterin-dependent oxidoreductase [Coriobacteriaceae bacterium]